MIKHFSVIFLYYGTILVLSAPVPRPDPNPSFAQAAIAALTFIHAGVIGYALQQQVETQSLIGIKEHYRMSHM